MGKFEADFAQPLTFRGVGIVVLNVVLEVRIALVPDFEDRAVNDRHVVREAAVQIEQRMRLDVQHALRQYPLLKLHSVLCNDAIEV